MNSRKSVVERTVDGKTFEVAEILKKKNLVFEVYTGCNGIGHVHTWASSEEERVQLEKP
jgi:hypothetical protein